VEPRTHLGIDRRWCGAPVELREGAATVALETVAEMAADARGLVHGGFVFGAADYAAMLAVNDPHVVLASAALDFLRPVAVGDRLLASAEVTATEGRRRVVRCSVSGPRGEVLRGELVCAVLREHVLEREARAASTAPEGGA
jgi:acyl-coenzyme A thioesterase PaaI-like protein